MTLKKWVTIVILDTPKDAESLAGKEGYGDINPEMNDLFPLNCKLKKKRTLLGAIKQMLDYSKLGIFSRILKQND